MRRLALLLVLALAFAGCGGSSGGSGEGEEDTGVAFCTHGATGEAAEECEKEGKEISEPADIALQRVAFGSGRTTPSDVVPSIRAQVRATTARTREFAPRAAAIPWEFVGPSNIGGRILDLALDPDQPDTVYAATAGGGVFRSTDRGVTLTSIWPDDLPQAVGALVMTRAGVLYAGTGEAGPGGGSLTYAGDGLYRSTDRGATWKRLPGLERTSRIGRIVVDPKNERRIWVAVVGDLFKGTPDRGVYLSEDGGDSWRKVLSGATPTTGAVDIAVDPQNPDRLIAATWDHVRKPDQRAYTGVGSGIHRSTDGGRTWTQVGLPLLLGDNPLLGRIGVAIDPQRPDTVYAIASGAAGNHLVFAKSTDFGATWIPIVSAEHAGLSGAFTYGWWFGRVWVDPRNSSNVYTAGLDLLKSSDGGLTFTSISNGMHVDQHALVWDPRDPQRMYAGNDGGLYRSDDGGATWKHAKVQPFSQPDALDVSEQDPRRIVAGLQDNGEIRNYPGKDWAEFGPGGDGQRVLISPKDKNFVIACAQNGACEVSRDGGNSGESFENKIVSVRKAFFMPIEFDPADPATLYAGGEIMSRSTDGGETWTPISPDLSDGGLTEQELNPLYRGFGALTAIGVGAGRLYAGTDDANVWYAAGAPVGPSSWKRSTDPDIPEAYVTRIEVDRRDSKIAYAAFSGFRKGDRATYLLRTTDGGASWDDVTGDLPRSPVNDVNIVDDKLVVATDFGVYASRDLGTTWYRVGRGLPLTPVYELRTHVPSRTVFAATFGRSIYKIGFAALDGVPADPPQQAAAVKRRRSFLGLPRLRPCRAGARLRFRVRARGVRLRRASIFVGKRRVRTVRGRSLQRVVSLKLPRHKVRVRIVATTADGQRLVAARTYQACPSRRTPRRS